MAVTYILRDTTSDGPGVVGSDFELDLTPGAAGTSNPLSVSVANSTTETSYGFTVANEPGTRGATGTTTVEVNITSANANIQLSTQLVRVNSAGTAQQSVAQSAEQSCGSTGVKTFTFTNADLGTWASGDRLRVSYIFRSTQTMGGAASVSIDRNTISCEVATPYTEGGQSINVNLVTETDATQTAGRLKTYAQGLTTETDTVNPHTRLRSRRLGLAW